MKILIIITSIDFDRAAITFGGLVARLTNAKVKLLHVVLPGKSMAAGESILEQAKKLLPVLPIETKLCDGRLVTRSLAELREKDHDLVVIGEGQRYALAQSTSRPLIRAIIQRSSASLLFARKSKSGLKRVLICTGGTSIAEPVIRGGALLASAAGARATLLHVVGTIPTMYTGLGGIEETLAELLKTDTPVAQNLRHGAEILEKYQVPAQLELRHGIVANEILREANIGDYDLIVTGAPERTKRLKRWLLGDVSNAVIERAQCPVLIVRQSLESTGDSK
ncbi:MAG TPA: universal stress protein [Anaerolineales bacterium]|jgi:nucleotide-binding universal stress UspA family protein|nr:universal stress protein [Anaerolineales bacterium]